jgi:hypothetical protein
MNRIPIHDASAPVACTITADEIPARLQLLASLRAAVAGVTRTDAGLRISFPRTTAVEADVREFATAEQRCCQFWGFAVDADRIGIVLHWDGPPAVSGLLDQLFGYFTGTNEISMIANVL